MEEVSADFERAFGQAAECHKAGRLEHAASLYRRALRIGPERAEAHNGLGNLYSDQGNPGLAAASYRQALGIRPNYAEAHNNLGNALFDQGALDEATRCYRQALAIKPDFAGAHNNLGTVLWERGMLDEAQASFRRALALAPDFAGARVNLGGVLFDRGEVQAAAACYREAQAERPDDIEAYGNLGLALWELGQLDEAEAVYRRVLTIKPDDIASLDNLAALLLARGGPVMALELIERSLHVAETAMARKLFVEIVNRLPLAHDDPRIRGMLARALDEAWVRPSKLAPAAAALIKRDPRLGAMVARAAQTWPRLLSAPELFGPDGLAACAQDKLLTALLCAAPNVDLGLERFLTLVRRLLLEAAMGSGGGEEGLNFYGALARQCFINEYVFFHTEEEIRAVEALRESLAAALESARPVSPLAVLAAAAYAPLHSLVFAERLLERQWPDALAAVLVQQVREPQRERQLRAAIPRLTPIRDPVSRLVQSQYEENPYPRWVKAPPAEDPADIRRYLSRKFPFAPFRRRGGEMTEFLVAGCGTGQHSIKTAQRYKGAQVLAVDLSLSALGYASRKSHELGLTGISYGQGDILELAALGRSFDVIESTGVLHHLADPWAGWRTLLSLLRPGGFMEVALYSKLARRNIIKARDFAAARGCPATADHIRSCRQDLLEAARSEDFQTSVTCEDFFNISNCRDLIFHVQEHPAGLDEIEAFLRGNNVIFLGFEVENDVLAAYRRHFPADRAATDLGQWRQFESEHPDSFFPMYQFWIQKPE